MRVPITLPRGGDSNSGKNWGEQASIRVKTKASDRANGCSTWGFGPSASWITRKGKRKRRGTQRKTNAGLFAIVIAMGTPHKE